MMVTEMGNRGSKLTTNITNHAGTAKLKRSKFVIAKEQRVDGSWFLNKQAATCFPRKGRKFKVYSNGFRKRLSDQNPF